MGTEPLWVLASHKQAVAWRGMMHEKAAPPGTNLQEKWGLTITDLNQ